MLQEKLKGVRIILASKSPRRKELLSELGIDFEVIVKDIEEIYPEYLQGYEIPIYLSQLKASAFESKELKNAILITSDTIVWHQNKKSGKPKTPQEAYQTLQSLSNATHEVITGVTLTSDKNKLSFSVTTKVTFGKLTEEEIHYYIKEYKPFDKAGSYGIQEWIGKIGVKSIEGDYYNVVGLPLFKLKEKLIEFIDI